MASTASRKRPHLFAPPVSIAHHTVQPKKKQKTDHKTANDGETGPEYEERGFTSGESDTNRPLISTDPDHPSNLVQPADFPHAPYVSKLQSRQRSVRAPWVRRNETARHYHVLNAMLHRCLLERDYRRAKRVFGTMLRYTPSGPGMMDLRERGAWGIAVQILLAEKSRAQSSQNTGFIGDDDEDEESENEAEQDDVLTPRKSRHARKHPGFDASLSLFERLILQYGYTKRGRTGSKEPNSMQFYPLMFKWWIIHVDDQMQQSSTEEIGSANLEEAERISTRLADVVAQPPFDKHEELLELQSMVEQWMSDLKSLGNASDSA